MSLVVANFSPANPPLSRHLLRLLLLTQLPIFTAQSENNQLRGIHTGYIPHFLLTRRLLTGTLGKSTRYGKEKVDNSGGYQKEPGQ